MKSIFIAFDQAHYEKIVAEDSGKGCHHHRTQTAFAAEYNGTAHTHAAFAVKGYVVDKHDAVLDHDTYKLLQPMKSIFIAFDQAHYEKIVEILERNNCRGFTAWDQVTGRGVRSLRGRSRFPGGFLV